MTHKFKVGDRVQCIFENKHFTGTIKGYDDDNLAFIEPDRAFHDDIIMHDHQLAPAPALVVIPDCVAEYIEDLKEKGASLYTAILNLTKEEDDAFEDWATAIDNPYETFGRAWIDGYEVEKEPLYMVELPNLAYQTYLIKNDDGILAWQNTGAGTKFTETEIKAVDERYWQFAVPVKEREG
ncbi:DUF1642 domain-containing protein [Listeria booriae]|uniref:DUF1642 domain-containing protein n=1 Tax=Listeria booriae TaxID=1552123 RepID=A0A842AGD9_9LIST|nr:DUF1642 domain-containing protein [Listeria booriae]MBC1615335.1 DUF1642 domain-containing protein [Listeria booriae]